MRLNLHVWERGNLKGFTSPPTPPTAPHKVLEGVNNVWGRRPTGRATLSSCFKVLRRTGGLQLW